jgi:hypothetical protein
MATDYSAALSWAGFLNSRERRGYWRILEWEDTGKWRRLTSEKPQKLHVFQVAVYVMNLYPR